MKLAQFPQLQELTRGQKLELAEELWMAALEDTKTLSADHRRLVDERWSKYRAGKVKRLTMNELEQRMAKR
jgi:hypothetical protein